MKQYPSIQNSNKAPNDLCYSFIKYDGSNLRFQWSKKQGWHLFGTRHQLFDKNHIEFGSAILLFFNKYADDIERIILTNNKFKGTDKVIVYCEFFGSKSFAGQHVLDDPKELVLFDVNVNKKGFLSPKEFIEIFGHLSVAEMVHYGELNESFINDVRNGTIKYESKFTIKTQIPEGIVCKGGSGHKLWMVKIKTKEYYNALLNKHPNDWQKYWE